jgi:hypothetical protein
MTNLPLREQMSKTHHYAAPALPNLDAKPEQMVFPVGAGVGELHLMSI